jgi:hypothetical protein
MQKICNPGDIDPAQTLAVIINCGTKWVTTLALMSVLTHTRYPVLLIDCESKDGSLKHFDFLARTRSLGFYWLEWPLRIHGLALDLLFNTVDAESVLLVDSDLEIRESRIVDRLAAALDLQPHHYGAGFLHGPEWLGAPHGLPDNVGYYVERMWIPLVQLRTKAIRDALHAGGSFAQHRDFIEFPEMPRLSQLLGHRFWLPLLRDIRLKRLGDSLDIESARRSAAFLEYDTGADMHGRLKALGYSFANLDQAFWNDVSHYHGVTRSAVSRPYRRLLQKVGIAHASNDISQSAILSQVHHRLKSIYGLSAEDFTCEKVEEFA